VFYFKGIRENRKQKIFHHHQNPSFQRVSAIGNGSMSSGGGGGSLFLF